MANAGDGLDDYPPDSDDSHDEDKRPNRWTGPPSTWQQLNSAEINTLTALNEIRNQDLSIHLYKAFALRHRHDERNNTAGAAKPVPNQVTHPHTDSYTGGHANEERRRAGHRCRDGAAGAGGQMGASEVVDGLASARERGAAPGLHEEDGRCR